MIADKLITDSMNILFQNPYYNCKLINNSNEELLISNYTLRYKLNDYFTDFIKGELDDSLIYIKFIDKCNNYLTFKISDYLFADIMLSKTLDNEPFENKFIKMWFEGIKDPLMKKIY